MCARPLADTPAGNAGCSAMKAPMTTRNHAIVWIDHLKARVFYVGLTGVDEVVLHAHLSTEHLHHKANTIGSGHAADDPRFLGEVAGALAQSGEILIIGPGGEKASFHHFCSSTIRRSRRLWSRSKPPIIPATPRSSHSRNGTFASPRPGTRRQTHRRPSPAHVRFDAGQGERTARPGLMFWNRGTGSRPAALRKQAPTNAMGGPAPTE